MNSSPLFLKFQTLLEKFGWNRMAKREQIMVGGLAAIVIALFFFSFILSPVLDNRQKLQNSVIKKQAELQEIKKLQKQYRSLESQNGDIKKRLATRSKSFSLFSFIEQQATTSGIKPQIQYLKPSAVESDGPLKETRVDMKLEKISLADLVKFLQGVESKENVVSVSRISIQESGQDKGYVNAVILLATFRVREEQ